jgi:hypothetical protein
MASSPYNSEVLRFFIRQTHRLKAKTGQTWRWAKVAATWGAQVAGATASGLWQWTRQGWQFARPALQASGTGFGKLTRWLMRSLPAPAALTADSPIRHILAAAQVADISESAPESLQPTDEAQSFRDLTGTLTKPSPWHPWRAIKRNFLRWVPLRRLRLPQPPPAQLSPQECGSPLTVPQGVQGIASDLTTGHLAWVTPQEIIVLEAAAHAMLAQRIEVELAAYDRQRRQLQRRQHLATWSQQSVTHVQASIWQAIVYFFGNPDNQSSALPDGQPAASLVSRRQRGILQPWATALRQPGQAVMPPLEAWKTSSIYHLICQAFEHFFGAQQPVLLDTRSGDPAVEALIPVGSSSFSLVLLPGLVELGQSIGGWLKRALRRWFPAVSVAPHAEILLTEPAVLNQAPILSQAPLTISSRLPRFQPVMVGVGNAAMTTPTSAGISTTWIEVPSTPIGYDQSLLVVLLTGLDWLLTQLEKGIVWLWRQAGLLLRMARWAWSHQNLSTVHLFSAVPSRSQGNINRWSGDIQR